jgi:hypothetical protein
MHSLAQLKNTPIRGRTRRKSRGQLVVGNVVRRHAHQAALVRKLILDELEDAQLNAIADERAEGPFIRVSLDDL